ncbi:MAG: hypothetical protein BGO29_03935 [Bacteroidales bacterium 36-12]|nr:MAG: hypothetical protein BGO29_03935 [Bacteroidales bacterium 36-12]
MSRKDEIVQIAVKVFLQKGYSKTTLTDIANAANIQKSSLFAHFKNKEEIYRLVIENYLFKVQTPKEKFGSIENISLQEFIEQYLHSVSRTMYFLHNVIQGNNKTSLHYFSFILEAVNEFEDYAKGALSFCEDEIVHWEKVINNAIQTREVRQDINALAVAQMFRYSYLGMSYTYTAKGGITIEDAKALLYNIYDTIKV